MTNDRSTNDSSGKSVIAVFLIVTGLMTLTSYAVEGKPLRDWWLPAAFLIVGVSLTLPQRSRRLVSSSSSRVEPNVNPTMPRIDPQNTREYMVAAPASAAHPSSEATHEDTHGATEAITRDPRGFGSLASTSVAEPDPDLVADEPEVQEINVPITATNVIDPLPPAPQTSAASPAPTEIADAPGEDEPGNVPAAAPAVDSPAPAITAQDLVRIDGIGPKIAAALYTAGIDSFDKLSGASEDHLREILSSAGIRLAPSLNTWASQAAFAARGDWDGMDSYNTARKS